MRRVPWAGGAVAALAVVVMLAACGGDDGPSKEEWTQQVEAVCDDVNGQLEKLPSPSEPAAIAETAKRAVAITTDGEKRLNDIEAPDDVADGYEELIDLLTQQTAASKRLGEAAENLDEEAARTEVETLTRLDKESNAKARELGLDACANE